MADPCTSLYRLRHLVCFMFLDWLSHLGMDSNPQIGFVRAYIVLFILLLYNVLNVSFCDGPLSIVHCRCVRACVNNCDGPSSIVHCRCVRACVNNCEAHRRSSSVGVYVRASTIVMAHRPSSIVGVYVRASTIVMAHRPSSIVGVIIRSFKGSFKMIHLHSTSSLIRKTIALMSL